VSAKPVYVIAPHGALRDRCVAGIPGCVVADPGSGLRALAAMPPGVVLVDVRGPALEELAEAGSALSPADGWALCAVAEEGGGTPCVRTISLGARHALEDVLEYAGDSPAKGRLLTLHGVLTEVSKARHDLNNPLTSALAEVQILLMDSDGGLAEESLLTIQEQRRRMRDLLLATRHLRP
jgi:hypothetical protein